MSYTEKVRAIIGERKPLAFVKTFGCQQNEADGEKYAGMAVSMGYGITEKPEEAELIIVNTCAVREHAELKALSVIGQYKHLKERNPSVIIAVGGCLVTQPHRAEEIRKSYPYVSIVFGTSNLQRLPEYIYIYLTNHKRQFAEPENYRICEGIPTYRYNRYRAWVSVMYGCDNFCSYCIVPYVRGRERSRDPKDVVEEVRELARSGYADITLLGQNVNSYGKDLKTGYDFADLIDEVSEIDGNFKIRFMTSHPKDATFKLIDSIAKSKKAARHFHLPLQSGSDEILERMNRRYDREGYLRKVLYMREKMPDIAVTSDIIVGFPGETEEDFLATVDMLEKIRFDMIFLFIYSPRKGTPAAEMDGQIPYAVKSERFARLLELQNKISYEVNQKYEGKIVETLCDGPSKGDKSVFGGRSDGNKIVFFDGEESDTGRYVKVKIKRAEAYALYGEKI